MTPRILVLWIVLAGVLGIAVGGSLHWSMAHPYHRTSDYAGDAQQTDGLELLPSHKGQAAPEEGKKHEEHDWSGPEAWLVYVTVPLMIFTALLYASTRSLAIDARNTGARQAAEMVSSLAIASTAATATQALAEAAAEANRLSRESAVVDRRPWLTLENAQLMEPTEITEDGALFHVSATVANIGKTPATSVRLEFESNFAVSGGPSFKERYEAFELRLRNSPPPLGCTLFPTDTYTENMKWVDPKEKVAPAIGARPSGERKILLEVFIGVSYRFDGTDFAHITFRPFIVHNVPVPWGPANDEVFELPSMAFVSGSTT